MMLGSKGPSIVLFILCKEVFQLLQETFRDRRESLISVPCYIQRSFKRGLQEAEHKAAPARRINQMAEGQQVSEPLPGKNGSIVGKPE